MFNLVNLLWIFLKLASNNFLLRITLLIHLHSCFKTVSVRESYTFRIWIQIIKFMAFIPVKLLWSLNFIWLYGIFLCTLFIEHSLFEKTHFSQKSPFIFVCFKLFVFIVNNKCLFIVIEFLCAMPMALQKHILLYIALS